MEDSFVHLHVHSEYSLLDSIARIDQLVHKAKKQGMKALAITDHGVMYGVLPFYKACKKAGIKPIIGCEIYIVRDDTDIQSVTRNQKMYHLLLLAETDKGYKNLIRLTTEAHLRGGYSKPCINKSLLYKYSAGLIAMSCCLSGEIPQAILQGQPQFAKRLIEDYIDVFGKDNFFFELQDHCLKDQQKVNHQLIAWSREMRIGLVATNDVHYIDKADHNIHDCFLCIGTGSKISDQERLRFAGDQYYFKSAQEMWQLFCYVPEALSNTAVIAERCQVTIPLGVYRFPSFTVPKGTSKEYLYEECYIGAKKRYGWVKDEVKKRLDYELSVVDEMGLNDYFLVVWDFVQFAHRSKIAIGPGRGSAAGSLVCYVLHITNVDPIRHHLLFERFLNPERISMPDIDIDFDYERRDEVIQYVKGKYGANCVAQIITFGTMAPRAAVRDVGRVLKISHKDVDQIAKLIPAGSLKLEHALETQPKLKKLMKTPQMERFFQTVCKIEGLPRHVSTHAAGLVISQEPLTQCVPLQQGSMEFPLTQYPMEVLEDIGFLKIDFLALRTLTVIRKTIKMIEKQEGTHVSFLNCKYDDPSTYHLLSVGDTVGVFQMDSSGIRKVLCELKPSIFDDIVAILALYRPGPMEQIPEFIQAKQGLKEVTYHHPDLKEILFSTYGVIVYQEQIMQIVAKMAGFNLGQADLLRRAIAKKNRKLLLEQGALFEKGCINNGYDKQIAHQVYHFIVQFANYGFNRSHSVAYGVLAYQTAYLKANYPLVFMTALLTTVMGNHSKLTEYIDEVRNMGITILPPDIHKSEYSFTMEKNRIRFGLGAIKNIGAYAIKSLLSARQKAPFIDLYDLCKRVNLRVCNRKVLEALILSGAIDSLPGHRSYNISILDEAIVKATQFQKMGFEDQFSLDVRDTSPFSLKEKLEYERELLGFYLTGHPLDDYRDVLITKKRLLINRIRHCVDQEQVAIAGIVKDVKKIVTKKGERMVFMVIEDQTGQYEVTVFPKVLQVSHKVLSINRPLWVEGVIQKRGAEVKLLANKIWDLNYLRVDKTVALIRISSQYETNEALCALKNVLLSYPGSVPVYLFYERKKKTIVLPIQKYGISPSQECILQIEVILGKQSFHIKERVPEL